MRRPWKGSLGAALGDWEPCVVGGSLCPPFRYPGPIGTTHPSLYGPLGPPARTDMRCTLFTPTNLS